MKKKSKSAIKWSTASKALRSMLKKSGAKIKRQGMAPQYIPKTNEKSLRKIMKQVGMAENEIHVPRKRDNFMVGMAGGGMIKSPLQGALHEAGHSVQPNLRKHSDLVYKGNIGQPVLSPREQEIGTVRQEVLANRSALKALKKSGATDAEQSEWRKLAQDQMKIGYRKPLAYGRVAQRTGGRMPKLSDAKEMLRENPHLRKKAVLFSAQDGKPPVDHKAILKTQEGEDAYWDSLAKKNKPIASRKTKKKLRNAIARAKNALINGTAGGYLGSMILGGGESGLRGARIGAGIGASIGALQNPRRRSATAGSVATGGDFTFSDKFSGFRKEHQNPNGGLNAKGRAAYNKATGSNLKAPQPKGGKRRDSFCARMQGMKDKLTSDKTANDPNSRINKSLRAWKCGDKRQANELSSQYGYPYRDPEEEEKKDMRIKRARKGLKVVIRGALNSMAARGGATEFSIDPYRPSDPYEAAKYDAMEAARELREAVLSKGKEIKSALIKKAKSPLARKIAIGGTLAGVAGYGAHRAMRKKRGESKPSKLKRAAQIAGGGSILAGAYLLPGAAPMLRMRGRQILAEAGKRQGVVGRIAKKIGADKAAENIHGKTVSDYLNAAQGALNRGVHGKVAGKVLQHAQNNPNSRLHKKLGRYGVDHFARFRSGHRQALGHWDYEVDSYLENKGLKRLRDKLAKGRDKANHAIDQQLWKHGKNESEAIRAVGRDPDADIQDYFKTISKSKDKVYGKYGKMAAASPALIAGGGLTIAATRERKEKKTKLASRQRLTELRDNMDQIERAYRVGDIHSRQGKVYARLEPAEKKKRRDPLQTARDAALTAGGAGLLYGGLRVGKEANKTANDPNSRINKSLRAWKCGDKRQANELSSQYGYPYRDPEEEEKKDMRIKRARKGLKVVIRGALNSMAAKGKLTELMTLGDGIATANKYAKPIGAALYVGNAMLPKWRKVDDETVRQTRASEGLLGVGADALALAGIDKASRVTNSGKAMRAIEAWRKSRSPSKRKNRIVKKAIARDLLPLIASVGTINVLRNKARKTIAKNYDEASKKDGSSYVRKNEFGLLGHSGKHKTPTILKGVPNIPPGTSAYQAPAGVRHTNKALIKGGYPSDWVDRSKSRKAGRILESGRFLPEIAAEMSGYKSSKDANKAIRRHEIIHSIQSSKRGFKVHKKIRDLVKDEVGAYGYMNRRVKGGSKVLRSINAAKGFPISVAIGVMGNPRLRKRAIKRSAQAAGIVGAGVLASKLKKDKPKEFGILAGLAGQMAVSPFTDKARKRIYQGVRGNIKSKKWGPRLARAASLAPDAIIGGGASIAADAAWEKFKPKKKEVATEFAGKATDRGESKRSRVADVGAISGASALTGGAVGYGISKINKKAIKKAIKKLDPTRGFRPGDSEPLSDEAKMGLKIRKIEDYATGDTWRQGSSSKTAGAFGSGALTQEEKAARMALQKSYRAKRRSIKAAAIGAALAGTAGAAWAIKNKPIKEKTRSQEEKYKKAGAAIGLKAGLVSGLVASTKNPMRPNLLPLIAGPAIGGGIGRLLGGAVGSRIKASKRETSAREAAKKKQSLSFAERLTELSKDMDQIERAYRVGDIHSRQGKVYARLEPAEKKKRRDPLQTARDAALTAGGAGLLYGGLRVGKEANKTGARARAGVDEMGKTWKSGVGSVRDTAEQAIKGVKSSVQNVVYDYHPQAVTDAIGDTVKGNIKGAIKRRFPRLSKIASKLLGKKIHASAKLKRLVELAHYPSDHPYWDDFYEEPVKRKAATPEEMDEVRRDRRKLLGIAAKAALLAPVAVYAVSGNAGVKAIRHAISGKIKKSFPKAYENKYVKNMFPEPPVVPSAVAAKADNASNISQFPGIKKPKKDKELSAIMLSDRDQLVDSDQRWASAWKGLRGAPVYRNRKRPDGSIARKDDMINAKTGEIIRGSGEVIRDRVLRGELIGHGQTIRSVYRSAKNVHKQGGRAIGLVKDAADTIRGVPRQKDPWGRRRKREWEKPWFKNAAGATAITVGGLALLKNPVVARNASKAMKKVANTANKFIPGIVPQAYESIRRIGEVLNEFDETAPNWDIRDQRGKSARVFAPGARRRDRREKMWHEKIGNERKLWGAGVVASGLLGVGVARRIGKSAGAVKDVVESVGEQPVRRVMRPSTRKFRPTSQATSAGINAAKRIKEIPKKAPKKAPRKPRNVINANIKWHA